ncbi:hypothetical protein SISSUDRAFT_445892 [Sistotremastrum suecicum HHB10207 ss-3]|uniref:Uncharacterized protein n=1 Tax=Sistotremastrum suecicum HHB10207 ss-3 TaxID=1314776 RepID=A0A165YAK2_9AGAM|nr:hypothetical protein SISSUDRAFT_445892 [Sistotremastrum suecicum HHB10207 ss-3]
MIVRCLDLLGCIRFRGRFRIFALVPFLFLLLLFRFCVVEDDLGCLDLHLFVHANGLFLILSFPLLPLFLLLLLLRFDPSLTLLLISFLRFRFNRQDLGLRLDFDLRFEGLRLDSTSATDEGREIPKTFACADTSTYTGAGTRRWKR